MTAMIWIVAYGSAWLLLGAAVGKASARRRPRPSGRDVPAIDAISRLAIPAELIAGLVLLSPASIPLPAGLLFVVFGATQAYMARRHPGLLCGCFGRIDEEATYSFGNAVLYLAIGAFLIGLAVLPEVGPPQSSVDGIVARIAGAVGPLSLIAVRTVSRFREVF